MPPLQMATPEQFATLRDYLLRSGFAEDLLRQKLGVKPGKELDLAGLAMRPALKRDLEDSQDALIQLFVRGEFLTAAEAASFFPPAVWDVLTHAGLVMSDPSDASRCFASVALYPVRDLFIASDRWSNPDHSAIVMFPDIVFAAMTPEAKQFLDYTSFAPCEDFLELCAGTAPAALLAARSTRRVWAIDIAERSVHFAKFNAALNDIHNVTILHGDLYQPVQGHTFDRIAAHPPYVPSLQPTEIFYGGGEDGEQITQKIICGLADRLKPGGRLYCRTMGTERPGQTFEQRIRVWLGEKQSQFDVALFVFRSVDPRQFAIEETLNRNGGKEQYADWGRLFERHNVYELLIGMVVIQSKAEERPAFTIRRTLRHGAGSAALERAMRWEAELQREGAVRRLLTGRPVATPGMQITVRHVLKDGQISPVDFTLANEYPFAMECKVQPWMALLLPHCDGKATAADLFDMAKQNSWIVPDTPAEEFCRLLGTLISGGFLEADEPKLPVAAG